jgi:membrane associated rhomboid family serine protease
MAFVTAAAVIAFVLFFAGARGVLPLALASDSHLRPWSFLTYPFVGPVFATGMNLINFVFALVAIFFCGIQLERVMGAKKYALLLLFSVAGMGLAMWIGLNLAGLTSSFADMYLPASAVIMTWCGTYSRSQIRLYGIIPVTGMWMAIILCVLLAISYITQPIVAASLLIPVIGLYFYGRGSLPGMSPARRQAVQETRAQSRYKPEYYDDVKKREQERLERERLRKLFEGNSKDDDG